MNDTITKTELPGVMAYADGTYAPVVFTLDYGTNWFAWVYNKHTNSYTKMQALNAAKHTIKVGTKGYLNDNWTSYTNGAAMLAWFANNDVHTEATINDITLSGFGDFSEDAEGKKTLFKAAKSYGLECYPTYYDHELRGNADTIEKLTLDLWSMARDEWEDNALTESDVA